MMHNKRGNVVLAFILGMIALFFVFIIYTTMTGPFESVRNSLNFSDYNTDQQSTVQNIDNMWHWAFIIIAVSIIIYIIIAAMQREPKEYQI